MRCIKSKSTDPIFNLATEEYLMHNYNEDIFMLWINDKCVVIGKNQNTYNEINSEYIKNNNITVIRRNSGGGAVFHDFGNINYTFITRKTKEDIQSNFITFTTPIVNFLNELGIKAYFSGRNDILVDEKKISGNAQYYYKDIILHHGTLIYDSDMEMLEKALNFNNEKYSTKAIQSIKSRTTKIKKYLNQDLNTYQFFDLIYNYILDNSNCNYDKELTDDENMEINNLCDKKWSTSEWTYGNNPKINYKNSLKFEGGLIELNLEIIEDRINNIKIYGDFFGKEDIYYLENKFYNIKYDIDTIFKIVETIDLNNYIYNLKNEDFINLFFK